VGLRPQTIGIADHRSAWRRISDHDARSYELIRDGQSEGLTRDDILDNITLTWLTNTAISGARPTGEKGRFFIISIRAERLPDELYPAELGGAGVSERSITTR
jgi:hypothetical protein